MMEVTETCKQHIRKDEKRKEVQYKKLNQVIENLLLPGTCFTNADSDSFFLSNGDMQIQKTN